MLENNLRGMQIRRRARSRAVVAYGDDVKVLVTSPSDFKIIHNAIQLYERAPGTRLNRNKSKALAIVRWNIPATELGIGFHSYVKILGVTFGNTIEESMKGSWTQITRAVRAQARNAYARELCLAQRVQ